MKNVDRKEFRIQIIECNLLTSANSYPVLYRVQMKGRFFWHTIASFDSEIIQTTLGKDIIWYDYGMFQAEELLGILQKTNP